ncbi:MAG: hypothetical protein HYY34_03700 [Chloroflexi bacterium]|nr:hypothetical protein [Chloroflexota bacterium]
MASVIRPTCRRGCLCELNPTYGLLFWLNTGHTRYGSAPESTFAAAGAGGNCVVVDPEHRMVAVTRWCSDVKGVIGRVVSAVV